MTVAESQSLRGDVSGGLCKCLFLRSKDPGFWLVAVPADMRVDLKKLAARLGTKRLSFAPENALFSLLGLRPGAVSVLGAANDREGLVRIALEESLFRSTQPLFFHPMVNTASVGLLPPDLTRFLKACDHEPVSVSDIHDIARENLP